MQKSYSTIISAADLGLNLDSVYVIDCRADLVNDHYGFEAFNRGRIPGAKFVDLNRDLSGESRVCEEDTPCQIEIIGSRQLGSLALEMTTRLLPMTMWEGCTRHGFGG